MAFNQGLARTFPGFGVPAAVSAANNTITGASIATATAYYIPSVSPFTTALAFPFGISVGRVRVKIYNGAGTSPVITKLQIAASDGTNTVIIADVNLGITIAVSSTKWFDQMFNFCLDVASTTAGAGGATGQLLPGGATSFSITPTMTGTSPTFTMDAEVLGLI